MPPKNANELLRKLTAELQNQYGHEAQPLAMILLEEVFALSRNDLLLGAPLKFSKQAQLLLEEYLGLLRQNIPVQQVVGWADFYGHRFKVNSDVLVPRQETEELVQMVSGLVKEKNYRSLIDIGTGSGCIAISLALENKALAVTALDISTPALDMAAANAKSLGAGLEFVQQNVLTDPLPGKYDVIVSNPPYVLDSEKKTMPANVLNHDPGMALFVPDEQPLLFYERLKAMAKVHLKKNGLLFFEINEKFGPEITNMLKQADFTGVELKNDLNNKPRFVFGFK